MPPSPPKPTDGELAILRVLWNRGPSTVRQVLGDLDPDTGYTTVLKLLQIMTVKGLVTRNDDTRTHIYAAAQREHVTQRRLLKDLLDRAFAGSTRDLVLQALSAKRTSPEELAEIKRLLEEHTKSDTKGGAA